ncbi:MAG: phospho-N-acetylmuramoyl-pentapeptide-transferase [Elainellaceae cyanobacterium]
MGATAKPAAAAGLLSGKALLLGLAAVAIAAVMALGWQHPALRNELLAALLLSTAATAAVGYWAVPALQALKAGQFIREDGPQSHLTKAGTPTMGGVFLVPVGVAAAVLLTNGAAAVLVAGGVTLAFAAIGWMDDWQVIRRRSNKGISPSMKLALQLVVGVAFCLWLFFTQPDEITTVALPGLALPLGWLFWLVAGFVPVAQSNATNLTDGLDGLMGGTGAIAFLSLAGLTAANHPDLAIFSVCMAGACVGFLVHNRHPARVFMGDTGSLALGGAMAAVGLLSQTLFGLLVVSGIFLAEALSVLMQVGYYKATKDENGVGKRLFKMAPLHHHLELSGWSELQIVTFLYGAGLLLGLMSLLLA